jgi:hypothetical protein
MFTLFTNLDVRDEGDGYFTLLNDLNWTYEPQKINITIPAGFRTDFYSTGCVNLKLHNAPSCLHDYLYQYHIINGKNITRAYADNVLYWAMLDTGVGFFERWTIYLGVRMFGGNYFAIRGHVR